MSFRKLSFVAMLGLLAWAALPDTSLAQRWGRGGRGVYVGTGYGGYGYGGYGYNRGYYGPGYGYNNYYGGYRPGFGAGLVVGSALSNNNYYGGGYYSNGAYYNGTGVAYSQPTSGYQSFYDGGISSGGYVGNDCCCASSNVMASSTYSTGGTATAQTSVQMQDGRGIVVLDNVPANAQVFWNGAPTYGGVRRFSVATSTLGDNGTPQKFEARWIGPDGRMVTQQREIRAQANQTINLDWNNATNDRGEEATAPNTPSNPNPNPNANPNPNLNPNPNVNPNPNANPNPNPNKGDRDR